MGQILFRFYASLNDFLTTDRRESLFTYSFKEISSIKDIIESFGVPHPEVDLILVNGNSVDFSYLAQDGDQIAVYPYSRDQSIISLVRPLPLTTIKFILDVHLGRLASYLRALGFDTLYRNDYDDPELAEVSSKEERILLTRDIGLLKRSNVVYGYWVRATKVETQLAEVIYRFGLIDAMQFFQRCLTCNSSLVPVEKSAIIDRLQPKTRDHFDQFSICPNCDQIYWAGSHFQRMQKFLDAIIQRVKEKREENHEGHEV